MTQLLILADDFTGALDTGVQFASTGAVTRVITGQRVSLEAYADTCEVLVVDAETRHLTGTEASGIVEGYTAQAVELDIPFIYKKTDSALRGNIGAELAAVLKASGERQLPFLPAFPQMLRHTVRGIHYIQGTPVADSVFGKDPFEPVTCSQVGQLLALQTQQPSVSCPVPGEDTALPEEEGIWIFDAESVEDLRATGRRLKQAGKLHILAGCAGFAAVLPELLELGTGKPQKIPALGDRFTVVCGSVNPITVDQLAYAEHHGFSHIQLAPEQKLTSGYWQTPAGEEMLARLYRMLETNPHRIIDTNDPGSNQETLAYAARYGMGIQDIRRAVSGTIGYLVSRLFSHEALGTLLITGGDTLLQCMEYMGIHEIEPIGELDTGVVLSRFTYSGITRYVISKSGGFGRENLLTELAAALNGAEA
ncbi:MAG: four-carbon acid sugar kinase family protein [Eubacteriales bacterium]|nr:four-carbon acid sugar kinase family protein [Eubacteriales bacterium]